MSHTVTPQKLLPTLLMALLIGGGLWITFIGWDQTTTLQQLDNGGAQVEGTVLGSRSSHPQARTRWWDLDVEYTPTNHPPIKETFGVSGSTFRKAVDSQKVTVFYVPENPRRATVDHHQILPFRILIGVGLFILSAGLLGLIHGWRNDWQWTTPARKA